MATPNTRRGTNPALDTRQTDPTLDTRRAAPAPDTRRRDARRASTTGLAVAAVGIVLFNIAQFLNWVEIDSGGPDDVNRTGYETDSVVPFIAFLGIGLLAALLYAMQRARRAQHRGLTLTTMAVGIGAALFSLAFALEPTGGLERGDDLQTQVGVYVAVIAAIIWVIGAAVFAKEIEGDDHEHTDNYVTDTTSVR